MQSTAQKPPPTSERPSSRRLRIALGTWIAIEASADSAARELAAIEAAYAAIAEVDRRMHPHRAGSDVARINTAPTHVTLTIGPDTAQVLRLAHRICDLTDGVFDPCLPTALGRLTDIELRDDELVCRLPVALDLGGIAKGYAIDRAIERLMEHECHGGSVNAGGDLRVFGSSQTILLRSAQGFRGIELTNAALAVSDLDATERPEEHRGYYNIRGATVERRYAAVVAKDAATADALTKCVLLCPEASARRALKALEAQSI